MTKKRIRWLPGVDMAARARRLRQYARQRRQRDRRQLALQFPPDPVPADAGQVKAEKKAA